MNELVRQQLRQIAEQYLGDERASHRIDHTIRVVENARQLCTSYPEAESDLLEAAAWLHDIGRGVERKKGISHADESARLADVLLPPMEFSSEEVKLIREAITDHRFSARRVPTSLEGRLLQDADRLDALGAVGIARTFAEGADRAFYNLSSPFPVDRKPDDERYSLDHFFTKLLTLPDTMHTPQAKAMGKQRVEYMRAFLREFACELGSTVAL